MSLFSVASRLLLALAAVAWLGGCFQLGAGAGDEERDPYFLSGKSHLNSMDYDGAISAFENALTSNPKSAAAHLELAVLYEEKRTNYAAAIYHYERHLALKPESNMGETIGQRILSCKVELAKTVPFAMISPLVQDEIRKLTANNAKLNSQIESLKGALAQQASVFSNRLAAAFQATSVVQTQPTLEPPERRTASIERQPAPVASSGRPTSAPRSHVVRPGETLATIARKYNLKLSALESANPGVEPKRLRSGQVLNLPFNRT